MIKLYGLKMSNYYSLTKALLIEKGLEFEEMKAPPRRCLPELLFNQPVSDETKNEVRKDLAKGMAAVARLAACDPFAAGKDFTIAEAAG
jgi:glutathione S-transferase